MLLELLWIFTLRYREPDAEKKFKEISNAYEVNYSLLNPAGSYACLLVIDLM